MAEVASTTPIKEEPSSSPTKSNPDTTSQKRKASHTENDHAKDDVTKRPKIESPGDTTSGARRDSHSSATSRPERHDLDRHAPDSRGRLGGPASKDEEKRRGKRLFGGLLGTLNQPGGGAQQKRRREIEQRQQERAQKHKLEADKRSAEKLSKITQVRKAEQINFDEKVMKTRHANMLARAHSLQTKAEPRIYYQPWKFTRAQEDAVDDQIADAKATIAREVEEFALRRDQHDRTAGRSRPSTSRDDTTVPEAADSSAPVPIPSKTTPAAVPESASATAPGAAPADHADDSSNPGSKNAHDHAAQHHDEPGDVVVEAEEDTVMY